MLISERAVESYRDQHGLADGDGRSVLDAQLSEINSQLIIARTERVEAEDGVECAGPFVAVDLAEYDDLDEYETTIEEREEYEPYIDRGMVIYAGVGKRERRERAHEALRRMVLIGHSMGGLVSKLQVVSSGNKLWNSIANQPFDQIVTDPWTRARIAPVR